MYYCLVTIFTQKNNLWKHTRQVTDNNYMSQLNAILMIYHTNYITFWICLLYFDYAIEKWTS